MSLSPREVLELFEASEGLLRGHFRLSSGLHSALYLQSARVLELPSRAERLGTALAERLRPLGADRVVSPALGGVLAGHEVARALGVPMAFVEKATDGAFELRRGFRFAPGERVVVVEDVLTTRSSAARAAAAVTTHGAVVVGVGALIDRGPGGEPLPCEPTVLATLEVETWPPGECPLCEAGAEPPRRPGSAAPGAAPAA